jgi:hypothetical protein
MFNTAQACAVKQACAVNYVLRMYGAGPMWLHGGSVGTKIVPHTAEWRFAARDTIVASVGDFPVWLLEYNQNVGLEQSKVVYSPEIVVSIPLCPIGKIPSPNRKINDERAHVRHTRGTQREGAEIGRETRWKESGWRE